MSAGGAAKTGAERQRERRQRLRRGGYVEILVTVHADDVERARAYADKLRRQRERGAKAGDKVK